ncbi:ATP-binding protein [Nonomuraea sp. NPDC002799]
MEPLSVDFDEGRVGRTRHAVYARARLLGVSGERLGDLVAAVNECVVNAVEHGGGHGRLRMWPQDGKLVCEVADDGPGISAGVLDEAGLPATSEPGGRGIWLMRRLSDEVVFTTGPEGTVVRLSMTLPVAGRSPEAGLVASRLTP